jgi:hypothetical protein
MLKAQATLDIEKGKAGGGDSGSEEVWTDWVGLNSPLQFTFFKVRHGTA